MAVLQREYGRKELLKQIRRSGPVARIELSRATGISPATVTAITAEFLDHGLIEQVTRKDAANETRRGRPRVGLKLRGAARMVVGIKISGCTLSLVLLDLEGTERAVLETEMDTAMHPPDALACILLRACAKLVHQAGCTMSDLSGIGLGIAGTIDAPSGLVYWSPSLSTGNVELAALLTRHLRVATFVDNDANLVALAEQSFGLGQNESDFIVVTIESGVGMGLIINGELYRGARGCGAEFGHMKVHLDGALCRCGQRGCLEAYVADYALLREAASLPGFDPNMRPERRIEALLEAARRGERAASSIVERAGRVFALGLANLVNIFDPKLIILAGEQMQFEHLYARAVVDAMEAQIIQADRPAPRVEIHRWGNLMWARGAAAYALDKVLDLALAGMDQNAS